MKKLIACLFLLMSSFSYGQLPWSSIWLDNAGGVYTAPVILAKGAVFQFTETTKTKTSIIARQPISTILFIRDCPADGEAYYPHLMGLRIDKNWLAAQSEWAWQGDETSDHGFPGLAFAPLVAHHTGSVGTLVADIDAKSVRPLYTRNKLALQYTFSPPIQMGQTVEFNHVVTQSTVANSRTAMHIMLNSYKLFWNDRTDYPELNPLNGYVSIQLVDYDNPLEHTVKRWADWGHQFKRFQFWGWTSDKYDHTANTSCCLPLGELHPRYKGIEHIVSLLKERGVSSAFYFRSDDPKIDEWLALPWPTAPRYIDVAGFRANVRRSYGPQDTIIEGVTIACDHAGLISGSITGGIGRVSGNMTHEVPVPWFGRILFDSRPLFLGDSNYDWAWTTPETGYKTYRQVLLLGAKLDSRDPSIPIVQLIIAAWNSSGFWSRQPKYLDMSGLANIPAGLDIRRFKGKNNETIIVYDQWETPLVRTVTIDESPMTIPANRLGIIVRP